MQRLNELFITEKLTDQDLINYAHTVMDKVVEDSNVVSQVSNNTREQAMLGHFPRAIDDAIMGSHEAHQDLMMQLLSDPMKKQQFDSLIYEMVRNKLQLVVR